MYIVLVMNGLTVCLGGDCRKENHQYLLIFMTIWRRWTEMKMTQRMKYVFGT